MDAAGYIVIIALLAAALGIALLRLKKAGQRNDSMGARLHQLENKVGDLQLETLESRLNPHLFKNILNSIQSHAYQTYFALDKLANVLDYILYESRRKWVTPQEEIAFALDLIEINKIKLSPLFELNVKNKSGSANGAFLQSVMAPLISVDLIENAFKHADLQSPDAFISVVFEFENDVFSLTVSNKISEKAALQKPKAGFGAESLEQRLRILYKERFSLERFTEGTVYTAHLKIDLPGFQDAMHIA